MPPPSSGLEDDLLVVKLLSEIVMSGLPSELERVVGERLAASLMEKLAWRAAREAFTEFYAAMGLRELSFADVVDALRSPQVKRLFRLGDRVEANDDRVVLSVEGARGLGMVAAATIAGIVGGAVAAAGFSVVPVMDRRTVFYLCAQGRKPSYIVYPVQRGEGWAIAIERVKC